MKLKLTTNIGKVDNSRLGLSKTMEGDVVDVTDKAKIDLILAKGWAVADDGSAPKKTAAQEAVVNVAPHEKIGGTKAAKFEDNPNK